MAVPPRDDAQPVRRCGASTVDLEALADWLAACGITTVALESTGVYGIPLCELSETRGFEELLFNPHQGQQITGRPTSDVHDGQWRPRLHPVGLLASAVRPTDHVCVLRRDLRPRALWLRDASQPIQHLPKALTQMHLTLQPVVRDVTGETGLAIMRAMLAGARDPVPWAPLRHDRGPHDAATMAQALHGQWREEPLCALAQAVALDVMSHQTSGACDRRIAAPLRTFAEHHDRAAALPGGRPRQRTRSRPHVDVRGSLHRITGVDLTAMEGSGEPTALTIIRESGLDLGRWPTMTHVPSWRGRCPQHRVSGSQG